MSELKTTTVIAAELAVLEREAAELKLWLDQVDAKQKRYRALVSSMSGWGEIKSKRVDLNDSKFPIYRASGWGNGRFERVVAVDENWITIRLDACDENDVDVYSRQTGRKKHSKSDHSKIDATKALAIWEAHTATTTP